MSTLPKIERLPDARVVCRVTFEPEKVKRSETDAIARLAQEVKLPGFRPGKAPAEMVREHVKEEAILEEIVRNLLPETFSSLLKEHNIKPIIHPKVELEFRNPLTLKITFVEKPEVTVKGIDKINIEKKKAAFDQKDVDRMEQYFLDQHRTYAPIDRASKAGDRVHLDFHGVDEAGKEIQGTRSVDYPVILGSKTLIPGFEDALVELRPGEQKFFKINFPEKYHEKSLSGAPVTFHATVKKVEEVHTPELSDEFAKKHFGVANRTELRKQIEERMQAEEDRIEQSRREQLLFEAIREKTQVKIAPELLEEEEHAVMQQFDEQLKSQGLTAQEWLKQSKKDPVELRKEMQERAEKRIRLRLGLEKVVEEKGKRLTDADMEQVIKEYLQSVPEEQRLEAASKFQKGSELYERLHWQTEVQRTIEHMLSQ
ncbi:MAG: trigger factor [Patescibacteria group bacterium]